MSLAQAKVVLHSLAQKRPAGGGRGTCKYEIVCELYDAIEKCRLIGHSWRQITESLKEAGVSMSKTTLQSVFQKIEKERKTGKGDWK